MANQTGLTLSHQEQMNEEMRNSLRNLESADQEAYWRWLSGQESEPPQAVKQVVTNLAQKINMTQGYLTAVSLSRMNRLSDFLKQAEELIFNPERLTSMSTEEILNLYDVGQKIYQSSMESSRKFVFQNKETLQDLEKPADELRQMLLSLPPNKLEKIRSIIEEASEEASGQT